MRRLGPVLFLLILLALTSPFVVSYGKDGPFVYQKGGRDPFLPWVTPDGKLIQGAGGFGNLEDVVLEGIIFDAQGGSFAMMNGRIVRQGDQVGRFEVVAIGREAVTLEAEGQRYTLRLKMPELGEKSP